MYCEVVGKEVIRFDGKLLSKCWDEKHAAQVAAKFNHWYTQGWPVEDW